jgi:hypothetical protein
MYSRGGSGERDAAVDDIRCRNISLRRLYKPGFCECEVVEL